MARYEYIIVGDSKNFKGSLIRQAGFTLEEAEGVLREVLATADEDGGVGTGVFRLTNIRIQQVESEKMWWRMWGTN